MRTRLGDSVSGRHYPVENSLLTKHVVAAGNSVRDAGSTPAASSLRSERSDERRLPRCRPSAGESGPVPRPDERSELRLGKPVNQKWNSHTFTSFKDGVLRLPRSLRPPPASINQQTRTNGHQGNRGVFRHDGNSDQLIKPKRFSQQGLIYHGTRSRVFP